MKNFPDKKAFTIMEILIVVTIIGVIATFAIPSYRKSVAKTHLQDAIMQLSAIRTANQIYFARTSSYWPAIADQTTTAINANLSLNIIENQMQYICGPGETVGTTFECTAQPTDNSFTVTVTQEPLSATNPVCTGSCP